MLGLPMLRRFFLWLLFLPLQVAIGVVFLVVEGARLLRLPFARRREVSPPRRHDLCSIVVLNWNGRRLLEECLPALVKAVRETGKDHEVMVVDNGSADGSVAWLGEHYPTVRILALDKNYGFGEGNNRGIQAASHDVVVLLNNDIIVDEDFLAPLLASFADPDVFAASSQVFFPPGRRREETGNTRAKMRSGFLEVSHEPIERFHYSRKRLPVLWAGGGASAFDRRRFLALGGFSEIFSPCYFEDTDLSYRAWRRGWKVLLAVESHVLHKHRSSSRSRFKAAELTALVERRRLWYFWKNYPLRTVLGSLLLLPVHLADRLAFRDYLGALGRLPQVLLSRWLEPTHRFGHKMFFRWIEHPLEYLDHFFPGRALTTRTDSLRILDVSAYLPHLGYHGGAGRVFQLLIRVARKHRVNLLSFVETEKEAEEIVQVAPHCRKTRVVYRRNFEPVSPFPYEPFEEFNSLEFRTKLEKLLTEEDFDLAHFEWTQMAQYRDLIRHIPTLLTEIEVNYAALQSQARLEKRLWRRFKRAYDTLQTMYREIEMCSRVDRVVCVTDVDRDFLRGYVPDEKLCVVNTGVDTQYFRPTPEAEIEPGSIVFVGAFRHQPNVDAMTFFCREIFPLIQEGAPQASLYIVGSAPPPEILKLTRNPGIHVTGFVQDIRDYYARAQVVVVPIRTGVGIRGKILEGWAAGKAMIATPVACLGIRAVHGENILIAEDPREFAMWTVALLGDQDFCLRIGADGRSTAERYYDWSKCADQLVSLYESLTGFATAEAVTEEAVAR
jgi:GT2 family glycosyltransferase/glycosyltransferase involved in cell wall biosynthesis